jgi:hypothetical protein
MDRTGRLVRSRLSVICLVFVASLLASVSRAADTATKGGEAPGFLTGEVDLVCSLTSGYGRAIKFSSNMEAILSDYESGRWSALGDRVASIGFGGDNTWYFLGRAAEGVGEFRVALAYYDRALAIKTGCRCILSGCGTVGKPESLISARKAAIASVEPLWDGWTPFERQRYLKLELRRHVLFHQCHVWSKGKSTEEMRKWLAALVAGAVAGVAVGNDSVGRNAGMGAAAGLSAQSTADVYRSIRFPERDPNRGKKYPELMSDCMTANGMTSAGDGASPAGWQFTEEGTVVEGGLRGSVDLIVSRSIDQCSLQLLYRNSATELVSPYLVMTLFDQDKNSLQSVKLELPAIYPQKAYSQFLDVPRAACNLAQSALVTIARDQGTGRDIEELRGVELVMRVP